MTDDINNLRFYMDETSAPYSDKDNPFNRTKEDDEFDKMIIEKYKLTTKEMENSSIMLAKQARLEQQKNGYVSVKCPKCNGTLKITMTSNCERTIISCPCGYIKNIEINF